MIIETERLVLRPWKKNKADAKDLYRYAKDPKVGPAAGWPVHMDPAHSLQIIREVLATPDIYAIVLRETGRPVGSAGLTYASTGRKFLKEDEAELGYWVGVPYWGKGIAAEAARALVRRAFTQLGMKRVWCGYYEGNERSRRVQQKCGFVYDHTVEKEEVKALGQIRTEHFTCLDIDRWMELQKGW